MSARRHIAIIVVLVLMAAAVNLPVAILFIRPARWSMMTTTATMPTALTGKQAASIPWPDRPAAGQPDWPHPIQVQITRNWGHTRYEIWGSSDNLGFQMKSDWYGWPLPVLAEANRWWPWDDPAWKSSEQPEIGLHMVWSGVLLNPLIFAMGAWIFLAAPFNAWRWLQARRRDRVGKCRKCGYPLMPSGLCPECGSVASEPAHETVKV